MRVYNFFCKTPLTLEMWYVTTTEKMTDCNMSCVRHDFHNFLDTSIVVTDKNCMGCIIYHVVCMGVTYIYAQENHPVSSANKATECATVSGIADNNI